MEIVIEATRIKCEGCAETIRKGLAEDLRIRSVDVDVPTGRVTVVSDADIGIDIRARLAELGYPPR